MRDQEAESDVVRRNMGLLSGAVSNRSQHYSVIWSGAWRAWDVHWVVRM